MDDAAIRRHLRDELARPDPWNLESNPFEQRRFDALIGALAGRAPFARALEVGCAAGAFTERLAAHCRELEVMDVAPEAIARTRARLPADYRLRGRTGDLAEADLPAARFDLIVAAEVLYYLPSKAALQRAVGALAQALAPGGLLVFGSASDEACGRWGLVAGAETTMALLAGQLREVSRTRRQGSYWGEDCLVVGYVRGVGG